MDYLKVIPIPERDQGNREFEFCFVFRQRQVHLAHIKSGHEFPLIKVNCASEAYLNQSFITGKIPAVTLHYFEYITD